MIRTRGNQEELRGFEGEISDFLIGGLEFRTFQTCLRMMKQRFSS